jgi:hypothetical protein
MERSISRTQRDIYSRSKALEGNGKGEATQDEASQGDASQRGAKKTLSATLSHGEWYRGMVDWMQFEDMSSRGKNVVEDKRMKTAHMCPSQLMMMMTTCNLLGFVASLFSLFGVLMPKGEK